ncbi:IS3 family transposase [Moraxella lacunata]
MIESFFGTLKQEIFYETTTFTSTDELKQVIDESLLQS